MTDTQPTATGAWGDATQSSAKPAKQPKQPKQPKEAKKSTVGVGARRRRRIIILVLIILAIFLLGTGIGIFIGQGFTITFNSTGGENLERMRVGRGAVALPTPIRPGYTFLGWTPEVQQQPENFITHTRSKNERLRAHWEETNFIINFYSEGELVNQLAYNETVGDPVRPGFTNTELVGANARYRSFFTPVEFGTSEWNTASFREDPESGHFKCPTTNRLGFLGWTFKNINGEQEFLWLNTRAWIRDPALEGDPNRPAGVAAANMPIPPPNDGGGGGWLYQYNLNLVSGTSNIRELSARTANSPAPFFPKLYDNTMHAVWQYRGVHKRVPTALGEILDPPTGQAVAPSDWRYGQTVSLRDLQYEGNQVLIGWRIDFRDRIAVSENMSPLRVDTLNGDIMDFNPAHTTVSQLQRQSNLSAQQLQRINELYDTVFPATGEFYVDPLLAYLAFQAPDGTSMARPNHTLYFEPVTIERHAETRFFDVNFNSITEHSGNLISGALHGIRRVTDASGEQRIRFGLPINRDHELWDFVGYYFDVYDAGVRVPFHESHIITLEEIRTAISNGLQGVEMCPRGLDGRGLQMVDYPYAVIFYEIWDAKEVTVKFDHGEVARANARGHYNDGRRRIHDITFGDTDNDRAIKTRHSNLGRNHADNCNHINCSCPSRAPVESMTAAAGSTIILPSASMFVRANMHFIGWQEVNQAGELGRIFPTGYAYTVSSEFGREYTLTAVWLDSKINFSFNLAGGAGYTSTELSQRMGGGRLRDGTPARNATLPNVEPTRFGYRFLHWTSNRVANQTFSPGATIPILSDKQVMTAHWAPLEVDMTLVVEFEHFDEATKQDSIIAGTIEMRNAGNKPIMFDESVRLHRILNNDVTFDPTVQRYRIGNTNATFTSMTRQVIRENEQPVNRQPVDATDLIQKITSEGGHFDSFYTLTGWTFRGQNNRFAVTTVRGTGYEGEPGIVNLTERTVRQEGSRLVSQGINRTEDRTVTITFWDPHDLGANRQRIGNPRSEVIGRMPMFSRTAHTGRVATLGRDLTHDFIGYLAVPTRVAVHDNWSPNFDANTGTYRADENDPRVRDYTIDGVTHRTGVRMLQFDSNGLINPTPEEGDFRITEPMHFYLWLRPKTVTIQFYNFNGADRSLSEGDRVMSFVREGRGSATIRPNVVNLRSETPSGNTPFGNVPAGTNRSHVDRAIAQNTRPGNQDFFFRHWEVEYLAHVPGHPSADGDGLVRIPATPDSGLSGRLDRNPEIVDIELNPATGLLPPNLEAILLRTDAVLRHDTSSGPSTGAIRAPVHTIRIRPVMRSLYEIDLNIVIDDVGIVGGTPATPAPPVTFTTTVTIPTASRQTITHGDGGFELTRPIIGGNVTLTEEMIMDTTIDIRYIGRIPTDY